MTSVERPVPPRHGIDPGEEKVRQQGQGKYRSVLLALIGIVGVLLGLGSWAMASPIGGSPDDDYHLASIWCPRPIEGSGCEFATTDGKVTSVTVPESLGAAACMAFHPEIDAACSSGLSDQKPVMTSRFDNGNYPLGFYHFNHLFVGTDVFRSVIVMRLSNVMLGLGLVVAAGLLASPKIRFAMIISTAVAWIPMGAYFISSNNPSSWSISGCMTYAVSLFAATQTSGARRNVLMVVGAAGVALSMSSRPDAAFFVFVISLSMWFLVPYARLQIPALLFSVVAGSIGLVVFLTSAHAQNLAADAGFPRVPGMSLVAVFVHDIYTLPEYFGNFWGLNAGPGWFDVPLPGWSTLTMIIAAGGLIFVGAQELYARKVLASGVILGALAGIPVVFMTLQHVPQTSYYQGRYMLPLLAVFFMIWLTSRSQENLFAATGQLVLLVAIVGVANSLALDRLIARYSQGIDAGGAVRGGATWWPWTMISPNGLWLVGSVSMVVGVSSLLWLALSQIRRSDLREVSNGKLL